MSEKLVGEIVKINRRDDKSKKPPYKAYTLWSMRIAGPDGNEFPDWIGFGFNKPQAEEGQYVELTVEREGKYVNAVPDSLRVVDAPVRRDPSGDAASANPVSDGATGAVLGAGKQTQIVLQHSQEMAIAMVTLLLNNKALPITTAQTKAAEAKRFDEIMAAVDKLTVQYFNDVVTGRLLDIVADAGADRVSTKADGPIPAVAEGSESDPSLDD